MAVGISLAGVLDSKRGPASVNDGVVREGGLSRIVLKHEASEEMVLSTLEIAVDDASRPLRDQDGLLAADDEGNIDCRHALGEVGIVREQSPRVADREDRGDDFDLGFAGCFPDALRGAFAMLKRPRTVQAQAVLWSTTARDELMNRSRPLCYVPAVALRRAGTVR